MAHTNEIRDPVHNFILFNDVEKGLINSPPVQRLKRIKQLAMTHEVYPGARHTRFEHCLGTMELATQAFDTIMRNEPDPLKDLAWRNDVNTYRQILRLGALLHDIGHPPFSHAPEALLPEGFNGHERFTEELILSDHIRPLLKDGPKTYDAERVADVAVDPKYRQVTEPSFQLLQEIVTGALGVDRMDYLVRDALHTGAVAGRFDYHRLINTLTVIYHPDSGSPVLAIEKGGIHAAEELLYSRYFMFIEVYFHDIRRIYDRHLQDFLQQYLPGGRFPTNLEDYLSHTDDNLEVEIMRHASGGEHQELASRLVGRNHYQVAFEMSEGAREVFEELDEHVSGKFGDDVRTDTPDKETQSIGPEEIYVLADDGTLKDILEESELILSLRPIWGGRVYARREIRDNVERECKAFVAEKGKGNERN